MEIPNNIASASKFCDTAIDVMENNTIHDQKSTRLFSIKSILDMGSFHLARNAQFTLLIIFLGISHLRY